MLTNVFFVCLFISLPRISELLSAISCYETHLGPVMTIEFSVDVFVTTLGLFICSSIVEGVSIWRDSLAQVRNKKGEQICCLGIF